jgi:hypothetical protein
MNRLFQSSASTNGVVTDYVGTRLQDSPPRKRQHKRKRGYPGFRIRMMDFYVEEIRAVVKCIGWDISHFVSFALHKACNEAATEIGLEPRDIARLSKRERAEIRRKYCLAQSVIRCLEPAHN